MSEPAKQQSCWPAPIPDAEGSALAREISRGLSLRPDQISDAVVMSVARQLSVCLAQHEGPWHPECQDMAQALLGCVTHGRMSPEDRRSLYTQSGPAAACEGLFSSSAYISVPALEGVVVAAMRYPLHADPSFGELETDAMGRAEVAQRAIERLGGFVATGKTASGRQSAAKAYEGLRARIIDSPSWKDRLEAPELCIRPEDRIPGPGNTLRASTFTEARHAALAKFVDLVENGDLTRLQQAWGSIAGLHGYSTSNRIVIAVQDPQATVVKSATEWAELGYRVKADATGIYVWTPSENRLHRPSGEADYEDQRAGKVSIHDYAPSTRRPVEVGQVFDIRHVEAVPGVTQGEPSKPSLLAGVSGDQAAFAARVMAEGLRGAGIFTSFAKVVEGLEPFHGGLRQGGELRILDGQGPVETIRVMAHEWAHELLRRAGRGEVTTTAEQELEADSAACMVVASLGLSTQQAKWAFLGGYGVRRESVAEAVKQAVRASEVILAEFRNAMDHILRSEDEQRNSLEEAAILTEAAVQDRAGRVHESFVKAVTAVGGKPMDMIQAMATAVVYTDFEDPTMAQRHRRRAFVEAYRMGVSAIEREHLGSARGAVRDPEAAFTSASDLIERGLADTIILAEKFEAADMASVQAAEQRVYETTNPEDAVRAIRSLGAVCDSTRNALGSLLNTLEAELEWTESVRPVSLHVVHAVEAAGHLKGLQADAAEGVEAALSRARHWAATDLPQVQGETLRPMNTVPDGFVLKAWAGNRCRSKDYLSDGYLVLSRTAMNERALVLLDSKPGAPPTLSAMDVIQVVTKMVHQAEGEKFSAKALGWYETTPSNSFETTTQSFVLFGADIKDSTDTRPLGWPEAKIPMDVFRLVRSSVRPDEVVVSPYRESDGTLVRGRQAVVFKRDGEPVAVYSAEEADAALSRFNGQVFNRSIRSAVPALLRPSSGIVEQDGRMMIS